MKKEKNNYNMVIKKQKKLEEVGLNTKKDREGKMKFFEKKKEILIKNKNNRKIMLLLRYSNLKIMGKQRIAE